MSTQERPHRALRPERFDLAAHPLGIHVGRLEHDEGLTRGRRLLDYLLVLYVEEGGGEHHQGRCSWEVGPGSVVVIAPGESFDASGLDASGWVLTLIPAALADRGAPTDTRFPLNGDPVHLVLLRAACLQDDLIVAEAERARWSRRLDELRGELADQRPGQPYAVRALATLVLADVSRLVVEEPALPGLHQRVVADAFAYIEEHLAEPLTPADVAAALARSTASVTKTVRQATGRSLSAWIAERKMAEARRLLLETEETVEDIAGRVGYTDGGYFSRRFKQMHDASPRDWRRAAREQQ